LTSFIFGTLQGVQDVLDDPFDGISEDDINLGPVRSKYKPSYLCIVIYMYHWLRAKPYRFGFIP